MVNLECPACDATIPVDHPLADTVRCEECSVSWVVTDVEPAQHRIAALAA